MAEIMAIEVAEYIERGLRVAANRSRSDWRVVETPGALLDADDRICRAGALGLAVVGKTGDARSALEDWRRAGRPAAENEFATAADLLGISVGLARLVGLNHENGVPAAEIAGALRTGTLGLSFRNHRAEEVALHAK